MKLSSLKSLGFTAITLAGILSAGSLQAGTAVATTTTTESSESGFAKWWNGKNATGNWFGVRDTLAEHGLTFTGKWQGFFYGVVDGGVSGRSGGYFDEQIVMATQLNFGKLLNVEALDALTAFGGVRYRDGLSPNLRVGASNNFNPSDIQSGKQWRLQTFGFTYSPTLFGQKDFFTATGGWLLPQREFIDQPLSKQFVNNGVESSKGLGANIPFSSSFSSWGGALRIKPVDWYYAKAGLFMSYPNATSTSNHGLAFEGYDPDTNLNGLFAIGETGFTPKIGPSELPGKYVFGGYYYEQNNTSYYGQAYKGFYGFYWQADQMLYREPTTEAPEPLGKGPSDGKSITEKFSPSNGKTFKEPVATEAPKLSDQGLYFFSLFTFAPKYNNSLPFYFHTGVVYKGLIPTRNADQTMAAFSFGQYSYYNIENLQDVGTTNQPNYTAVVELDYRIQINGWSYLQPYFQYIIQPNGTGAIENASVLGFEAGVVF